jgi:hypothetical protein
LIVLKRQKIPADTAAINHGVIPPEVDCKMITALVSNSPEAKGARAFCTIAVQGLS